MPSYRDNTETPFDMGYKNGDMEDWDTISQLLDVIIDRYKLYGSGFDLPGNMGLSGQVRPQAEREGTGKELAGKVRGGETNFSPPRPFVRFEVLRFSQGVMLQSPLSQFS